MLFISVSSIARGAARRFSLGIGEDQIVCGHLGGSSSVARVVRPVDPLPYLASLRKFMFLFLG